MHRFSNKRQEEKNIHRPCWSQQDIQHASCSSLRTRSNVQLYYLCSITYQRGEKHNKRTAEQTFTGCYTCCSVTVTNQEPAPPAPCRSRKIQVNAQTVFVTSSDNQEAQCSFLQRLMTSDVASVSNVCSYSGLLGFF